MRITPTIATAGASLLLFVSACSGSSASSQATVATSDTVSSSTSTSTSVADTGTAVSAAAPTTEATTSTTVSVPASTTLPGAVDPNAPEVVEPGDIPDNQVFIAYTSPDGGYTVKVPEGWARTEAGGVVTFTDTYNSIALQSSAGSTAPTVDTVRTDGLSDVASDPTFKLLDVAPVTRKAGTGVLATYEIGSAPNPVTGKKALLAVERFVFFHTGTVVTMTLSGAKGADNVDPWKIVSNSLSWN